MAGPRLAYAAAGSERGAGDRHRLATGADHLAAARSECGRPDRAGDIPVSAARRAARPSTCRRSSTRICSASRRPLRRRNRREGSQSQMNLVLSAVFATNDPQGPGDHRRVGTGRQGLHGRCHGASGHEAACGLCRPGHSRSRRSARSPGVAETKHGERADQPAARSRAAPISNSPTTCAGIAENNPARSPRWCVRSRCSPTASSAVTACIPGRNRQQFAKLGLQPGDLVLSVNGTPLDDPQRGMEIFNTIGTSDRVDA